MKEQLTTMKINSIPNFSRYYADSNGNIYQADYANKTITLTLIPAKVGHNGYINYQLTDDNNKLQHILGGRLVLLAFRADEFFTGADCDHINKDTTDNRLENVRWLSHSDNCKGRVQPQPEKDRPLYLIYDDGTCELYGCRKHTNIPSPTLSKILNHGQHSQKYGCTGFYWDKLHQQPENVKKLVTDYAVLNMIF